jgi:protein-tyrosine phosphatase
MKPAHILVVCTGNVCRSPMAMALLRGAAARRGDAERYAFSSAGTWGLDDEPASQFAQLEIADRGLSLADHRARTVSREIVDGADLILVMTRSHRDALAAEFPDVLPRLHLLSELGGVEYDINDPYRQPREVYRTCARELEELVERGYHRLDKWLAAVTPDRAARS